MTRLPVCLALTATLLAAGSAGAEGADVVLLPVETAKGVPARYATRVDGSLAEAAGGMRVVGAAERRGAARTGCAGDAACWAEVGLKLKAGRVVGTTLAPAANRGVTVTILLVEVQSGAILSKSERTFQSTSLAAGPRRQLADVLWQAPAATRHSARETAAAPPSTAAPTATVAGEPAPVVEPAPAPVATSPAPSATPPVTATDRPRRGARLLRPLKWASAGGAVAAIAVGAALLAIDGSSDCARGAGQRQCPDVRDTLGVGAALVAVGGALAATSVALFVLDRRWGARRSWAGTVVPTASGAFVTVGGRF